MRRFCFLVALLLLAGPLHAQVVEHVVTVQRDGYTISGLVSLLPGPKTFKYGILQFPGNPGIMRMREENGSPVFGLKGNTLVRSRTDWLDAETLVLTVDAPSDEWSSFGHSFRQTPRYGQDIAALVAELVRKFPVQSWTFVGHSEGAVSAYHAASMNPALAQRVAMFGSLFQPNRNGTGLSGLSWDDLSPKLLWVHHQDDPCRSTLYRDAVNFARKSNSPLLTVRGGTAESGGACEARTFHGFVGTERLTIEAVHSWVKTGKVPPDVEYKTPAEN